MLYEVITHQAEQVDRAVDLKHVFLREVDVVEEYLEKVVVDSLLNFQPDGGPATKVAELFSYNFV